MTKPIIGFIGLGLIGGNASEAASPKALAEASDIVMLRATATCRRYLTTS